MEYLTSLLSRLSIHTNYYFAYPKKYIPPSSVFLREEPLAIKAHKDTVLHAMQKYCYASTIDEVVNKMTSSTLTTTEVSTRTFTRHSAPLPVKPTS
jgi:hypothetical protein